MNTAEIIALISLCCTIIFALPPFINMFVEFCKSKFEYKIIGGDIREDTIIVLSIQVINRFNTRLSITEIKVNKKNTFIQDYEGLKSSKCISFNALENKVLRIACPCLKYEESIEIAIYTTKRKKPYKLNLPSYVNLPNILIKE